ncbi:MAG: TetR/AcrR family transcriptional regulator [Deltaproteobacteria bacterium]
MRKNTTSDPEVKPRRNNDLFQKRQTQIIKKATKLFMEKGYSQTSMREISKATGIDIRNLYYFIKSKDEILFLVCQMIHTPMMKIVNNPSIMGIDDPVEQLHTVIHQLIDFGFDYGQEILLMYRESKSLSKPLRKIIFQQESLLVSRIESILKKGKERKVFQYDDSSFTANFIVYGFSIHPLRHWNMKKYSKQKLMALLEKELMRTVMV